MKGNYNRKPNVLHIGVSYYNNEFLASGLRKKGWKVDVVVSGGEGARNFLHNENKYILNKCFYPVPKRYPCLFDTLLPIMQCCGASDIVCPEDCGEDDFFHRMLDYPPEELENQLREHSPGIGRELGSLSCVCARWLETAHDKDLPSIGLKPVLTESPVGVNLLRRLFQLFLRTVRAPHPELEIFEDLVGGAYDIVHFTGVNSMRFMYWFAMDLFGFKPIFWDINILKRLGIKIVYSQVACFDGVSASAFNAYRPEICALCNWRNSEYCNDIANCEWGEIRNRLADYQIMSGGCRIDFNRQEDIHEVPEFYCVDENLWKPGTHSHRDRANLVLYHAVGNYDLRTNGGKNIKCTHVYRPVVDSLRAKGYGVELDIVTNVPNSQIMERQRNADIICDQLTYGWYGANAREGMMLGKPVVCYLRPEWLKNVARELPALVEELPIVSATPETVETVLEELLNNPEKREILGKRGREFAVKWHGVDSGVKRMEEIYSSLVN